MIDELSEEVVAATESNGNDERVARGAVLTDRDRQVVGYLAIARYLSTTQLHRLAYPGRTLPPCRRRLMRLSGLWKTSKHKPTKAGVQENFVPPYLRRREYRTFGGEIAEVWALTDAGHLLAEQVLRAQLRVPRADVSAEFLEHDVALNEVLIGLVDPTCRPCPRCGKSGLRWQARGADAHAPACTCGHVLDQGVARVEEIGFRWTTTESNRLPWTEYDRKSGKTQERVILPDGVLELGGRRFFLECEMGTHSIVGNEFKNGATLAKCERYEKFLNGIADPKVGDTFYRQAYPDGAAAEVLFLVTSEVRRDHVNAAITAWKKKGRRLAARALTLAEAPNVLLGGEGAASASPPAQDIGTLTRDEVRELQRFYSEVIAPIKRARAVARAARTSLPEYPPGAQAVGELVQRLAGTAAPDGSRSSQ